MTWSPEAHNVEILCNAQCASFLAPASNASSNHSHTQLFLTLRLMTNDVNLACMLQKLRCQPSSCKQHACLLDKHHKLRNRKRNKQQAGDLSKPVEHKSIHNNFFRPVTPCSLLAIFSGNGWCTHLLAIAPDHHTAFIHTR